MAIIRDFVRKARKSRLFSMGKCLCRNSQYYGLLQSSGDCTILSCADFLETAEIIPKWSKSEKGYKVITAIKTESKGNLITRFLRTKYYKLIRAFSDNEIIEFFTEFSCYDRSFLKMLKQVNEPIPFLRGIIAEFA